MASLANEFTNLKDNITSADTKNSLTGNIDTARLIIKDCRLLTTNSLSNEMVIRRASEVRSGGSDLVRDTLAADTDKIFKVQFNPNKLSLYATSLDINSSDTQAGEGGTQSSCPDTPVNPTVELTVNLIFDHVNNYDAFMWDKLRIGVGGAVAKAADALKNGTKVYTVQTEVEGLVAALRNPYTRSITFSWADFSFTGQLKNVRASYTMFSVSGRPIRAQVLLRIRQKLDAQLLQNWYDDFNNAFNKEGINSSSLTTMPQGFSNLINLGL